MQYRDTAAFVTGASRGLGRCLARSLAAAGARVVLSARHAADLEAVVGEIRADGGDAHALVADVGDIGAAAAVASQAAALVGPIDIAVHNASTLGVLPLPVMLDTEPEGLARVFAVNVFGPFALTRALAGSMLVRGRGVVVNISSDAGVEAYPQWGGYGASKAALDHMTRTWAVEFDGTPVRFLSVDPGEMDTAMHADAMPDADPALLDRPEDIAARILALVTEEQLVPSGARVQAKWWEAQR